MEQIPKSNSQPNSQIPPLSLITGIFWAMAFMIDIYCLGDENAPCDLFTIVGLLLVISLIANLRNATGYRNLMTGRKPGVIVFILCLFMTLIPKHGFDGVKAINIWIVIFSIAFSVFFSFAVLFRNKNFKQGSVISPIDIVGVGGFGLIIGFGLSLLVNCSETLDTKQTYAVAINDKYIKTVKGKLGIYQTPHFIVQPWPGSNVFGNDIVAGNRFSDFLDIENIRAGDSIYLDIHQGLFKLNWMEPQKFIQEPH